MTDNRRQMTDNRRQMTDNRRQKTDNRKQIAEYKNRYWMRKKLEPAKLVSVYPRIGIAFFIK
jgi:hypothetical protein